MGIGSSLKKAIKKVIPKEVSAIAPIVAPFNPALAAGLGALGGYRDDGFSGALRGGLGSYALGQGARWLGGAGFQSNPFVEGGAFRGWGSGGLREGFSSPFGTKTGLGEFLSRDKTIPVEEVDTGIADEVIQQQTTPMEYREEYDPGGLRDVLTTNGDLLTEGPASFSEWISTFIQAPLGTKWDMAKRWFDGLDNKTKLALGVGSVAAAMTYLENQSMEGEGEVVLGSAPGYMTDIRGTSPAFTNPTLSIGQYVKDGGIIGLANGGEPTMEMDYRGGGFIPVGAYERADDVPARLSKNEFVMTADAVRAAGGGSVDVGAQRMYNLMNQLEGAA